MTLRWALVGASDIAATRIIPAMLAAGQQPVVVQSGSLDRAATFARDHDMALFTTDLDEALSEDIDAVYISSTNDKHAVQALAAIAAGRPVLCEKPLALNPDDAQAMIDAADQANVVLATNHHLRHSPVHRMLHTLFADGEIGQLLAVRVSHAVLLPERLRGWRIDAKAPGAGVIPDITVHDTDTVRFVTGREPVKISAVGLAQGGLGGAVDSVVTAAELSGGALWQTYDAFTCPHAQTSFELHGTAGSLIATNAMTQDPVGDVVLRRDGKESVLQLPDTDDLYQRALKEFEAAVAGQPSSVATGVDGLRSLLTAYAAEESLQTGTVIDIPAPRPTRNLAVC